MGPANSAALSVGIYVGIHNVIPKVKASKRKLLYNIFKIGVDKEKE